MSITNRIDQRVHSRGALADRHPETTTRRHVMSVNSDDVQTMAPYTYLNAIVSYVDHVWVRKGVSVITDNSQALPLFILRDKERLDKHDALTVLKHANPQNSLADLWHQWIIDMLLGGEEGWELVKSKRGKIAEIWPKQPNVFGVLPDQANKRYFAVRGYEIDDGQGEPYTLTPDEFIHFKFFNPANPWRGIGVLLALRLSIAIDVLSQAWERFLYKNNARPDYAIITPQGTTQSERDDIIKKVMQQHGGAEHAGEPIALETGITDIKMLSWRPRDLGELEIRKMKRDEIAGGLGVPDILMGFGNDSYDTPDKRTSAIQALFTLTIKPLLGFRDEKLTSAYQRLGLLADNESLHTDYSSVAELNEEADSEWARESEKIATGVLTINDYLKAHGKNPLPWGNVWWAPSTLVPIVGAPISADGTLPATSLQPAKSLQIAQTTQGDPHATQ